MIADAALPAEELRDLASAIARLSPNWCDPERFFERRSEIAGRLRDLAREIESGGNYRVAHE